MLKHVDYWNLWKSHSFEWKAQERKCKIHLPMAIFAALNAHFQCWFCCSPKLLSIHIENTLLNLAIQFSHEGSNNDAQKPLQWCHNEKCKQIMVLQIKIASWCYFGQQKQNANQWCHFCTIGFITTFDVFDNRHLSWVIFCLGFLIFLPQCPPCFGQKWAQPRSFKWFQMPNPMLCACKILRIWVLSEVHFTNKEALHELLSVQKISKWTQKEWPIAMMCFWLQQGFMGTNDAVAIAIWCEWTFKCCFY